MARRTISLLTVALFLAAAAGPRHPLVALVEEQFPKAKAWFRLVAGVEWRRAGGGLSPDWATLSHPKVLRQDPAGQRLQLELPLQAGGALELSLDGRDGFWVRVTPLDVRPVTAQVADGLVLYPGAYAGGDLLYKATPTQLDEYVYYAQPRPRHVARFRLELGPGVQAARLGGTALELFDAEGNARLRARPPFARDLAGARRDGRLRLDGDVLTTDVDLEGLTFPVLVDPDWMTTGRMLWERFSNDALTLPSGDVLAPGGCTLVVCPEGLGMPACSVVLDRTELYQASSGTWRDVAVMAAARFGYVSALLPQSRVLVAGGCTTPRCTAVTAAAEVYDVAQNAWAPVAALPSAVAWASATPLSNGEVLVAGGCGPNSCVATTAVFSPAQSTWRAAAPMAVARGLHTATALPDGRVLVVGGCVDSACNAVLPTAETYDPAQDRWSPAGALLSPRSGHAATLLAGGDVLVTGGCASRACMPTLDTAERWSPGLNTFRAAARMATRRHHHAATGTSAGRVLVAGGCADGGMCTRESELYDPLTDSWEPEPQLSVNRGYMAGALLRDGRWLLAGGCNENTCLPWAETYQTDAGVRDAGSADAGARDAGLPDAGGAPRPDAGAPDAGHEAPPPPRRCGCSAGAEGVAALLAAVWLARRARRRSLT